MKPKSCMVMKEFNVIIEKDSSGWFIADVPELHGCHTQGKTKKEVIENIKEVISLCVTHQKEKGTKPSKTFVGIEKVLAHV